MSANKVESLANWYLRFNGYFTVPNFTVHPDIRRGREAEADILAVRFPHSCEEPGNYRFARDTNIVLSDVIDVLIVEVKSGWCDLNDPWTDPKRRNIQYVLWWMGFAPDPDHIEQLAQSIHTTGMGEHSEYVVRLASFGRKYNEELQKRYPDMVQIRLLDAIEFARDRLTTGCARLNRQHWDTYIQEFARRAEAGQSARNLLDWTLEEERQE